MTTRRTPLILGALAAALAFAGAPAWAQQAKLKVGLMLPYTGTFAALGTAIENGFRLYVAEQGGKLGDGDGAGGARQRHDADRSQRRRRCRDRPDVRPAHLPQFVL